MKELSIEEKAKAYDEAYERVAIRFGSNIADEIFPELAESEDEKIRNFLISTYTGLPEDSTFGGFLCKDILAWLERQGEQNITDKIKPKFHKGDWITNGDYTWKIIEVKPLDYILQAQDGNIVDDTIYHVDEQFHSFTIEDAKDGDVLADDRAILLFRSIGNRIWKNVISYYAILETNINNRFSISDDEEYWGKIEDCELKPASKEQCDLLFQKMHESRYTFDFEKKELKEIEDEEYNGEDYGIDSLYHAQRILEKTLGSVDGYQSDDGILDHKAAITAVKKLYKQKPWSEEDKDYFDAIITKLEVTQEDAALTDNQMNFLKSLKSKIHPKQEWSEEDVYNSKLILATVSKDQDLSLETKDKLTSWLKSIEKRMGGKV